MPNRSLPTPLPPFSFSEGTPVIAFRAEDVAVVPTPFRLAVIGKFSLKRLTVDVVRRVFGKMSFVTAITASPAHPRGGLPAIKEILDYRISPYAGVQMGARF